MIVQRQKDLKIDWFERVEVVQRNLQSAQRLHIVGLPPLVLVEELYEYVPSHNSIFEQALLSVLLVVIPKYLGVTHFVNHLLIPNRVPLLDTS